MEERLSLQKTYDGNNNSVVGIISACGQNNDMFYSHHNVLLPVGNNITAIERSVYECMLVGCQSIWINCHPSITNILKLYFGHYFKNPHWNRLKRFTDFPIAPKYIPIYYMNPNWKDLNQRTSWIYCGLSAAKMADSILNQFFETTKYIKYYFAFPNAVLRFEKGRAVAKKVKESDNFCFEFEGKTFKDNLYASFTLRGEQIKDCFEKLTFLETEYTDYGFNSRFFPISKVLKHLDITKFETMPLKAYYPIYTNKKYFDYLQKGDYYYINKKSNLIKNYLNVRLPKYEGNQNES